MSALRPALCCREEKTRSERTTEIQSEWRSYQEPTKGQQLEILCYSLSICVLLLKTIKRSPAEGRQLSLLALIWTQYTHIEYRANKPLIISRCNCMCWNYVNIISVAGNYSWAPRFQGVTLSRNTGQTASCFFCSIPGRLNLRWRALPSRTVDVLDTAWPAVNTATDDCEDSVITDKTQHMRYTLTYPGFRETEAHWTRHSLTEQLLSQGLL